MYPEQITNFWILEVPTKIHKMSSRTFVISNRLLDCHFFSSKKSVTELSLSMSELSFLPLEKKIITFCDRSGKCVTEVAFYWQKWPFFFCKNRTVFFRGKKCQKCPFPNELYSQIFFRENLLSTQILFCFLRKTNKYKLLKICKKTKTTFWLNFTKTISFTTAE